MTPSIARQGEFALCLRWPAAIDPATSAEVHRAADCLQRWALPGVREWVPAYASLLLVLDRERCLAEPHWPKQLASELRQRLRAEPRRAESARESAPIEIPVCYGGPHGIDLEPLAERCGLSPQAFAQRHAEAVYPVAMLGFAPGFPYLLGLAADLQAPRHARPRTRVAAGSVAIGGAQTGIYPNAGPGGWQLIGRTPLRLWNPHEVRPSLLQASDRVRFVAIDEAEFDRRNEHPP